MAIGDRIAQFILERIAIPELVEHSEKLDDTIRGEGGFGSTGVSVRFDFIDFSVEFYLQKDEQPNPKMVKIAQ